MVIDFKENGGNGAEDKKKSSDRPSAPSAPAQEIDENEELSRKLCQKALERVRAIAKGNGVPTKAIILKEGCADIIYFEARNRFKIENAVSEKNVAGRENGEVCSGRGDIQQRIQTAGEALTKNKEIHSYTKQLLEKRPELGFAATDIVIKLDKYNKRFVVHESCSVCRGDGKIECKHCHGKGREICERCHGERFMMCTQCRGTRMMNTANGQQRCTMCNGEGRIPCRYCHQTGQQQCRNCKATGQIPCNECNRTGWRSRVSTMQVRALAAFEFDEENMPQELPQIIKDLRGAFITEKHGQARIINDTKREEALGAKTNRQDYIIGYDVWVPWGDITFLIKRKAQDLPLEGKIFGYQAEVLFLPDFLDNFTHKALSTMQEAALGRGNIAEKIHNAARYRVVREAVLAAARFSPGKGKKFLETKYPFGFSGGALSKLLQNTDTALKHITKAPRQKGLIFGLVLATALQALYFLSPIREIITAMLPSVPARAALDMAITALCAFIAVTTIKITAKKALHDAIGKILPPAVRQKLMPKAGSAAFYAILGTLGAFLALNEATTHIANIATPEWFSFIRGKILP